MFLMLFCANSALFSEVQLMSEEPINGRTDTPFYRDARTHLKNDVISNDIVAIRVDG